MSIKQETCRRLGLPCDGVAITHLTAGQLATALRAFKACEALTERGARGIDAALIEAIAGITGAEPACCRAGGAAGGAAAARPPRRGSHHRGAAGVQPSSQGGQEPSRIRRDSKPLRAAGLDTALAQHVAKPLRRRSGA
uniref:Uncharacterized protein n=1 Tax=Klebsiella pneumoniae TaxID=573 RepID=A0A2I7ZGH1_KLEPN|nr:hypothetical protein [Klebsiella pneumoniae]